MRSIVWQIFCLTLLMFSRDSFAQQFQSGPTQTTLIELYTSQGCSSCPPAEEYLNGLKEHPGLWKDLIPIALHVDYWDYIGWKDRFASPEHALRQRRYAQVNTQRTIYTPALFVNGRPWYGPLNSVPKVTKTQVGTLKVDFEDDRVTASFMPYASFATEELSLSLSIVGMGLKTQIKAGENAGRFSRHEFVKLDGVSVVSSNNQWRFRLPKMDTIKAEQYVLVAWVSKKADPRPLQAVGGYLR